MIELEIVPDVTSLQELMGLLQLSNFVPFFSYTSRSFLGNGG